MSAADGPRPGSIAEAIVEGSLKRNYGEESRRYRRAVYRHEDWLKHRREDRLLRNLRGIFSSGVMRSLYPEVGAVATSRGPGPGFRNCSNDANSAHAARET